MRLLQKIQKLEVTNMIKAFCVLFADNYRNDDLQGLVRNRTAAALPVISRYRMVDFMIFIKNNL